MDRLQDQSILKIEEHWQLVCKWGLWVVLRLEIQCENDCISPHFLKVVVACAIMSRTNSRRKSHFAIYHLSIAFSSGQLDSSDGWEKLDFQDVFQLTNNKQFSSFMNGPFKCPFNNRNFSGAGWKIFWRENYHSIKYFRKLNRGIGVDEFPPKN